MDLYKASFHFGFVQKSKMATTTRHFLTRRTQWKYELKAFSQKLQTVHTKLGERIQSVVNNIIIFQYFM